MAPSKTGAPRALPRSFQFKGVPMGFAAAGFPALIAASMLLSALAPADVTLGSWVGCGAPDDCRIAGRISHLCGRADEHHGSTTLSAG